MASRDNDDSCSNEENFSIVNFNEKKRFRCDICRRYLSSKHSMAVEKDHKVIAPDCLASMAETHLREFMPLTNSDFYDVREYLLLPNSDFYDVTLAPSYSREAVLIPRPSVLKANMGIFTDMQAFCQLTGYKPLNTNMAVHRVAGKLPNLVHKVRALGSMVQSFRRAFNFQSQYELLEERPENELFPRSAINEWRRKKQELLSKFSKHEDCVKKLMEARKECWMSESKVKKYRLITAVQTSALRYNPNDSKGRTKALHEMQKVLVKKEKLHVKACGHFQSMLLAEISLRETVHKISEELEGAILDEIHSGIHRLMKAYRQDVRDEVIGKLARVVYKKTCRQYQYDFVELEPCHKMWIKAPAFVDSEINGEQTQKLMK